MFTDFVLAALLSLCLFFAAFLLFFYVLVLVSRLIFGNGFHSHGAPAPGSIRQRLLFSLFPPLHPYYKGMGETKIKKAPSAEMLII